MKKALSLLLALVLCIGLCACSTQAPYSEDGENNLSPKERLNDEVKEYISENFRITNGGSASEAVNVDIASVVDMSENEWAVLGTYTVKIEKEIMSAKFGLVATYDEANEKFIFSQEEFDDFK